MGVLVNNSGLESWLWEYTARVRAVLLDEGKDVSNKKEVAKAIYHGLKHGYGFREALETGVYAPTPDELSQTNCASQMVVNYLIAKELSLNPQIVEVDGLRRQSSGYMASHAFIEVDVGEDLPWTVDQTMLLLGPIRWDRDSKKIIVNNCAKDDEFEDDHGDQVFSYSIAYRYDEAEYEERLSYQRSKEGAAGALLTGQKVGNFEINKWKMQKPTMSTWYFKFNPKQRTIESLVSFQRPLIQNRGVINRLYLNEDCEPEREEVTGYFYAEEGFAEFLGETPMFVLPIEKALVLADNVVKLPLDQHYALENKVQAFCLGEIKDHRQVELIVEASKESLADLARRDRVRSDARWKFILTEALYQHKRKQSGKELVYSPRDRTVAFELLKDTNEKIACALKEMQRYEKEKRWDKKMERRADHWTRRILTDPRRREKENVALYTRIRNERQMILYQMESSMKTVEEAGDRIAFIQFDLKDHLASLESLGEEAQKRFGEDDFDKWLDAAYARLFVEFLGNTAAGLFQLRFLPYRSSVIDNIRSYRNPLFRVVDEKESKEKQRESRLESLLKFLKRKAKETLAS